MPADSDSNPDRSLAVVNERLHGLKEDIAVVLLTLRDLDMRVRQVETERSQRFQELEAKVFALEQWRRDQENAVKVEARVREPWVGLFWKGMAAIVVAIAVGGAGIVWKFLMGGNQ